MKWSTSDLPSLTDKFAIVTGANSGLGYHTSLALSGAGANVILAVRDEVKGEQAKSTILLTHPQAKLKVKKLDLCSLASVSEFCQDINSSGNAVDILINNAGTAFLPERRETCDGFEVIFQGNYLSHFALTCQLLPSLRKSSQLARVVNVSSRSSNFGSIDFNDLQNKFKYWFCDGYRAYCQSKLANLLFTYELQRRSLEGNWGIIALSSHPGSAFTNINANKAENGNSFGAFILKGLFVNALLSQGPEDGALPQLFAATSPKVKPGAYYGPDSIFGLSGKGVREAWLRSPARDPIVARKLWEVSEKLCNISWPIN